jgi:hypothetical protein
MNVRFPVRTASHGTVYIVEKVVTDAGRIVLTDEEGRRWTTDPRRQLLLVPYHGDE